jgi:hypothetical protein
MPQPILFGARDLLESRKVSFVERLKKVVFLELRQKHMAMGHSVRCYINFHLFDTQKLVRKQRTARLRSASKPNCINGAD